jgi:hypothetical protein
MTTGAFLEDIMSTSLGRVRCYAVILLVGASLSATSRVELAASPAPSAVTVVADSVADFSGVQGTSGWLYGYYPGPAPFTSASFTQMPQFVPGANPQLANGGDTWYEDAAQYWTQLWASGGHPNSVSTTGGRQPVDQWAVRRWVSSMTGTLTLTGTYAKLNSPGDGTTGHILVDGNEIWVQHVDGSDTTGVNYSLSATVHIGSTIDFGIEAGPTDGADATKFTAVISSGPALTADFDYKMGNRFGPALDANAGDGEAAVLKYPDVIAPSLLTVELNACSASGAFLYRWSLPPGSAPSELVTTGACSILVRLPAGKQPVTLTTFFSAGTQSAVLSKIINVRDVLVVSIGDSIASGEGNPDAFGICSDPETNTIITASTPCRQEPVWFPQYPNATGTGLDNKVCHRSTRSAAALAAIGLNTLDPHTSVTFLHVACSGASINGRSALKSSGDGGLLTSQDRTDTHSGKTATLPPQLRQVVEAVSDVSVPLRPRPIDALVINVGADDISFADILQECITKGVLNLQPHFPVFGSLDCGADREQKAIENSLLQPAMRKLAHSFDLLHECVSGAAAHCPNGNFLGMDAGHVFIMAYPDPAHNGDGSFCSGFPLTSGAWRWAEESILQPLNRLISQKAALYGWNVVDGYNSSTPLPDKFQTHGYCAADTWIRGGLYDPAKTSLDGQRGSYGIQGDHDGLMHPNKSGHQRMAQSLEAALVAKLMP